MYNSKECKRNKSLCITLISGLVTVIRYLKEKIKHIRSNKLQETFRVFLRLASK